MEMSSDIALLAAALVKAQPMIEGAKKDSINPHFKSKYADLAAVWDASRDALQANDLAVSQLTDHMPDGAPALRTILLHKSGQWIAGLYPLVSIKQDPQSLGSSISYARRYGLAAVMGVISEDDDGSAASKPAKPSAPIVAAPSQAGAPRMTPTDWATQASEAITAFSTIMGLDTWCKKNDAAIAKLVETSPALANTLTAKIDIRRRELAGGR